MDVVIGSTVVAAGVNPAFALVLVPVFVGAAWNGLWDRVRVINDTSERIGVSVSSSSEYSIASGQCEEWSRSKSNGNVTITINFRGRIFRALKSVGSIKASEMIRI